jgi:hypothetical protein
MFFSHPFPKTPGSSAKEKKLLLTTNVVGGPIGAHSQLTTLVSVKQNKGY